MTGDLERTSARPEQEPATARRPVDARLERAAAYSWRLLVVAAAAVAVLWLTGRLLVVVLPIFVALLIARVLLPVARWLRARRLPRALAAALTLLAFLLALAALVAVVSASLAGEIDELGPTLSTALDDVEDWLVEDSPFDVSRQDIDDFRETASDRVSEGLESQSGTVVSGTVVAFEVITGLVLSMVTTFFLLKDGARFCAWLLTFVPQDREPLARRLAARSWQTLGGYLRGSATLGIIEGTIIGLTVWIVGGALAVPVAVITFFAAFLPFAGAVLAGTVAVMVTLVTAGTTPAIIVLVVAVLVQQFDNDLLAPIVFGKNLELHALVVLAAIVAGSTLFGAFGAVLAVPTTAVVLNATAEWRAVNREADETVVDAAAVPADGGGT
jgi:putative heme transporter